MLQEQLSHYLDCVEDHIAKQVSQKSGAFFHTMTSHDTLMEQMGRACGEVRHLRAKIQAVDKMLACDSLRLAGFARSRTNQVISHPSLRKLSMCILDALITLRAGRFWKNKHWFYVKLNYLCNKMFRAYSHSSMHCWLPMSTLHNRWSDSYQICQQYF